MEALIGFVLLALVVVVGGAIYLLPAIVASKRNHTNRGSILVLNLLLGWTFIGWVAALVWAFTSSVDPRMASAPQQEPSWMGGPKPQPLSNASAAERTCPYCAETVKAAAIVCKHCGRDLPALAVSQPSPPIDSIDAEAAALGITWSSTVERYIWRSEFFKDLGAAVEYAKANSAVRP